jgi:hypothetical protein
MSTMEPGPGRESNFVVRVRDRDVDGVEVAEKRAMIGGRDQEGGKLMSSSGSEHRVATRDVAAESTIS